MLRYLRKRQLSIYFFFYYLFFYKLFWTQACPEGIGTNGTQRSHARCHPYPIPQPVKVGHTTGVYVLYSFRTVVWVLLRPTRTDQWKCCETGPTVFRPYPRRLESLTSGDVITKAALSSQLFKDLECWSGRGLNPPPPAQQTGALPTELTRRRFTAAAVTVFWMISIVSYICFCIIF